GGVLWHTTNLINRLAVSANEKVVATLDTLGGIHVWDRVSGGEICKVQTGEQDRNTDFSFSPADPDHILAWVGLKSVGILDYRSGHTDTFPLSDMHSFSNPAFSPDGREFAFGGPTNIMILDMETRKPRPFVAIDKAVYCLAFSPNGALLASAQRGGNLTLWDRASGREITCTSAHPPAAFSVEFSRDGRLLASGGSDGTAKLWEVLSGSLKSLRTLPGHVGWVDVTFSPDGRRLLSNSTGNALRIWDIKTGLEVGTLYSPGGRFAGFAFSRDGNTIYSG